MKWWKAIAVIAALAGGAWLIRFVTTPPPGVRYEDQGQQHVTAEEVSKFQYNSNPPSSGPHLPTWVKPGVYDSPQPEGELLHSLEHGYIVVGYNCNAANKQSLRRFFVPVVYADHPEDTGLPEEASALGSPAVAEASGSAKNATNECGLLISELEALVRRKKLFKLVLVPRPKQDAVVTLAAWTYIDKLSAFDAKRIDRFIDYHRDHGPEQTME